MVAAIVTAVAYMGSLLAHELAHSLVARRNGVQVEGITLWLLGGVSRLQGEIPDPGAEVRVAGVGPLTSLVLGGGVRGDVLTMAVSAITTRAGPDLGGRSGSGRRPHRR